jgi:hypothetical protein
MTIFVHMGGLSMPYAIVSLLLYPFGPVVCCIAVEEAPNEDQCLIHTEERERLQKRINASVVTCQHCHQCAFCEPRYDICNAGWKRIIQGKNGKLY